MQFSTLELHVLDTRHSDDSLSCFRFHQLLTGCLFPLACSFKMFTYVSFQRICLAAFRAYKSFSFVFWQVRGQTAWGCENPITLEAWVLNSGMLFLVSTKGSNTEVSKSTPGIRAGKPPTFRQRLLYAPCPVVGVISISVLAFISVD